MLIKKQRRVLSFIVTAVMFLGILAVDMPGVKACHKTKAQEPVVYLQGYIPGKGWTDVTTDGVVGMIDQGQTFKAFKIGIMDSPYEGGVHSMIVGIESGLNNNRLSRHSIDAPCGSMSDMCGVIDKPDPLSQVQFNLTGEISEHYDIVYRVYAKNQGWTAWEENGYAARGDNYQTIEAINVKLVSRDTEEQPEHTHHHKHHFWFFGCHYGRK